MTRPRDHAEQMFEPARPTRAIEGLAMLAVEAATRLGFVITVAQAETALGWSNVTVWRVLRLLHRRRMLRRVQRGRGCAPAAYRLAPRGVRWLARFRDGRVRPTWRDEVLDAEASIVRCVRRELPTSRRRAA